MRKRLRNPSSTTIVRIKGVVNITLGPGEEYEVSTEELDDFINCMYLTAAIQSGRVEVGDEDKFYSDALEGEAFFKTTYDGDAYVVEGSSLNRYTPEIVTDSNTGKKGTSMFMGYLGLLKELYNTPTDPLYEASFQPFLGVDGREIEHINRTANLENIHSAIGWHTLAIKKGDYEKPKDILFYNGWPNSFNSSKNSWNNELVAQDMSKYSMIIFSEGIANTGHGDYANLVIIIDRIKEINSGIEIFGTVSNNQSVADFKTEVDEWEDIQVHGILIDDAGYNYGSVATNGRDAFNEKVEYIHDLVYATVCFVNVDNMDNILGIVNDISYPNTTWNASLNESNLNSYDWCLISNHAVGTTEYSGSSNIEPKSDWYSRMINAIGHRYTYGISLAAIAEIDVTTIDAQRLFNFEYISACMWALEAVGSSDVWYGASSASVVYYSRPDVTRHLGKIWDVSPDVEEDSVDSDIYWRHLDYGRLMLDFSSGSEISNIERYNVTTVTPVWEDELITSDIYVFDSKKLKLDSSGGVFTVYLPSVPKGYMEIYFLDVSDSCGTNSITINRNGQLIMGLSSDMTISTDGANFSLLWAGSTYGWRVRD